ncbi:hypothetical protein KN398_17750 [Acinetobacter baumannii]|uniref:hypothetical protein n=1 Tax=Acinetobacter baumannii TaxID=470 RepID=UPI001C03D198|nr:hypothetical protein [Acinetobacter baumannii]MBU0364032.1 hypothetical protein [Acinetobacter baumannii]
MYKFLALSFISIGLVACNKTSEDSALTINNQEYMPKHQLTANKYIYEYNNIIYNLRNNSDQKSINLKLKKLLNTMPSNEDNLAILKTKRKILIRLGCLEQAYVITEKMLTKANNSKLQETQCIFLKRMKKDISLIKQCYEKTASSYLNEINLIPKAQLWYQYALWGNYAAMYHAGHKEYRLKLLELINYHNNEDHRLTYRQMYESVVNPSILQKRIDRIPYSHECR